MEKINQFRLIDLEESHLQTVLHWRNQESIRKVMFHDKVITWTEHKSWFNKIRNNPTARIKLFYQNDTPLGIVKVTNIDKENNLCYWGFYLGEKSTQKGIGTIMGYLALNYIFDELNIRKLSAEILDFNEKSIMFHQKLGFEKESTFKKHIISEKQDKGVILMALLEDTWKKQRHIIKSKIEGLSIWDK